MNYYKFECKTSNPEILLAFLSHLPFDTFQENEDILDAFVSEKEYYPELDQEVADLQQTFPFSFRKIFIPYQNWNKKWEDNFTPIEVDDFCGIRADFHPEFSDKEHVLIINPKMAFGTGHHETTRSVIRMMKKMEADGKTGFENKRVLDYGCGTGVLAFLAEKLGATDLVGVEIEEPAYLNALENAASNDIKNLQLHCGTLELVDESPYDIILANINRNVLLNSMSALKKLLKKDGIILFSGVLSQDLEVMTASFAENGLSLKGRIEENDWQCLRVEHEA